MITGMAATPGLSIQSAGLASGTGVMRALSAGVQGFGESVASVAEAVQRDIEAIRRRDADLADSALAASALALACEIDAEGNSATSKSMCARELRDTLDRLRELAPKTKTKDRVDDLSDRRAKRRGAAA
jgi:hypothetical protein